MLRMPTRTSAAEVALAAMLFIAMPASAEPSAHDFGVFADAAATQSTLEVPGFSPRTIYIVGFGLDGEVKGFEFSVNLPPEATVLNTWFGPGCDLGCGWPWPNVIVGTGGCFVGEPRYQLGTVTFGFFGSEEALPDRLVCLGPATPSSPALDDRPGYLQCDGDLVPFGLAQNGGEFYPDGCLVINPTHPLDGPVALENIRMGALKARFGVD